MLLPRRRLLAAVFGIYSSSFAIFHIFSESPGVWQEWPGVFSTRETVDMDVPASSAIFFNDI